MGDPPQNIVLTHEQFNQLLAQINPAAQVQPPQVPRSARPKMEPPAEFVPGDAQGYASWKRRVDEFLEMWKDAADFDKAFMIKKSLPDALQKSVEETIDVADFSAADSHVRITDWVKERYGEDDLVTNSRYLEEADAYARTNEPTFKEYVTKFESHVLRAQLAGEQLTDKAKMLRLLNRAGLSRDAKARIQQNLATLDATKQTYSEMRKQILALDTTETTRPTAEVRVATINADSQVSRVYWTNEGKGPRHDGSQHRGRTPDRRFHGKGKHRWQSRGDGKGKRDRSPRKGDRSRSPRGGKDKGKGKYVPWCWDGDACRDKRNCRFFHRGDRSHSRDARGRSQTPSDRRGSPTFGRGVSPRAGPHY